MSEQTSPDELRPERPPKDFYEILIVDDEPAARNMLRSILEVRGYKQVDEANSGQLALEKLNEKEYHVILLDKNMPGIDGIEVLRIGKAIQPECEFIMITAYGSLESAIQSLDLGAYSYLTKPFEELDVIVRRVEGALERVITRRENALLVDRLRFMLDKHDQAEAKPEQTDLAQASLAGHERGLERRVWGSIGWLRKLVSHLGRLRESTSGIMAEEIEKATKEVYGVIDMLVGKNSSKEK